MTSCGVFPSGIFPIKLLSIWFRHKGYYLFVIKHFTKYTLCCRTHLTTLSHLLAVGGVTVCNLANYLKVKHDNLVPHYNNHSDSNGNQSSTGNEHQRQRRLPTAQNARADN